MHIWRNDRSHCRCGRAPLLSVMKTTGLTGIRDQLPSDVLLVFQPAEEGAPLDEAGGVRSVGALRVVVTGPVNG